MGELFWSGAKVVWKLDSYFTVGHGTSQYFIKIVGCVSYSKTQLWFATKYLRDSAGIYLFKVNGNTITSEICSKLTVMTSFWCLHRVDFTKYSHVSIVDFEKVITGWRATLKVHVWYWKYFVIVLPWMFSLFQKCLEKSTPKSSKKYWATSIFHKYQNKHPWWNLPIRRK